MPAVPGRCSSIWHGRLTGDFIYNSSSRSMRRAPRWSMFQGVGRFFPLIMMVASSVYLCATARGDQSVSVGWDASLDPSVTGYIVYVGQASGNYSASYNVGT